MPTAVLIGLLAVGRASTVSTEFEKFERGVERAITRALKFTKGKGGEPAVGAIVGFGAGCACKQTLATAVKVGVTLGVAVAGAYYFGYLDDEQVRQLRSEAQNKADAAAAVLPRMLRRIGIDCDGSLTSFRGKLAFAKVGPFAKRHVGFTGGLVGGFAAGYTLW